jgi:deoxyribonuclease-4
MIAKPLLIGAHTSAAGGVQNALLEGQEIGATTIQLFTANQRQWASKPIDGKTVGLWETALTETGLTSIMSHDSYLINLGAPDPENLRKSRIAFRQELERCHSLKIAYLNFHPGAALKEGVDLCIERIAESLLEMKDLILAGPTKILLEATAGQGSVVGAKFEELGAIIRLVDKHFPIGVTIDTCHIFAAGYDIRTEKAWLETLEQFDEHVGAKYLCAFHLNDSKKGLGSRVDRHEELGKGAIGWDAFRFLVTNPRTRHLPMYLETPGGPSLWKREIAELKTIYLESL